MNCQELLEKISEYIDKEIDPTLCQEIEEHVEDCEPCVAFINTLKKTVEMFEGYSEQSQGIPGPVSKNLKDYLRENLKEEE